MKEFIALCFTKPVIKRASLTALVVGTILIVINHGDALIRGQMDANRLFKIILTVCVPYIVSTVSSASTVLSMTKGQS
ncbi:MAG: nitrate/nitrite transporter NrtS [Anaerolineae bacterium]|nr:nitrate/nitrite transporter NrtS [Anaerolineae bacterium]MCI0609171.1 nitrate/nitrite transporter NrtS [Anaerolineae bacterium]